MSAPLRAMIYARQSLDSSGEGAAVERQEAACRGLATARGWEVVGVEIDNSISASKGLERPAWERVLGMIDRQEIDVVVAWHLDRITRTMTELERLILLAEAKGVGVSTATGDIDLTTDSGRMVARILAAVARAEVERKGERQRAQNQQRVAAGKPRWSRRPFGYEKDGTFREDEAKQLRWAYEQVLAGNRISSIVKTWNEEGVTTSLGAKWTTQSLGKLLRDPRNAGRIRYRREDVGEGDWEPIIDLDTWHVALSRMGRPEMKGAKASPSGAMLVTVAECGTCHGPIFTVKRSKGSGERFYTCQKGCTHLPVDWVDGRVFIALMGILEDPEHREHWEARVATESGDAADLRERHAILTERLSTFSQDYADGFLTRQQMIDGTTRVRENLAEIEKQLDGITASTEGGMMWDVEWFAQQMDEMQPDELRSLLRNVTQRISLGRRGKGNVGLWPELVEVVPKGVPDLHAV